MQWKTGRNHNDDIFWFAKSLNGYWDITRLFKGKLVYSIDQSSIDLLVARNSTVLYFDTLEEAKNACEMAESMIDQTDGIRCSLGDGYV